MEQHAVRWFEIYAQERLRARQCYEGVFGYSLTRLDAGDIEMWAFRSHPKATGTSGALVQVEGFKPGPGGTLVYFACENCAVEESRVTAFGGRVHRPKISIGAFGHVSLVYDSEGNLIGLDSMN
jgi:predicted enzyme related to lactoylglutathione lyase